MNLDNFSKIFIEERNRLGLKQIELAEKIGVSRITIGNYEVRSGLPGLEVLKKLEEVGFDIKKLLGMETETSVPEHKNDTEKNSYAKENTPPKKVFHKVPDGAKLTPEDIDSIKARALAKYKSMN